MRAPCMCAAILHFEHPKAYRCCAPGMRAGITALDCANDVGVLDQFSNSCGADASDAEISGVLLCSDACASALDAIVNVRACPFAVQHAENCLHAAVHVVSNVTARLRYFNVKSQPTAPHWPRFE